MPSARPRQIHRLALLAACASLACGVATGCATTQDTAKLKQAESKRILEAREKKQREKRKERR